MSTFRGFTIESKSYMGYDNMDTIEKIGFWLRYPSAWTKYHWYGLRDYWRRK